MTPRWTSSPGASGAAWPLPACCSPNQTCCCWTSPPTTWTPSPWPGFSITWRISPAASSSSPTTVISWIRSPSGRLSSIGARAFPMKATTQLGWNRRRSASARSRARARPASAPWLANWNGSGPQPRPARRNPRRASPPMTRWSISRSGRSRASPLSRFRQGPGLAMW